MICRNNVMISCNEDYDEKLAFSDEDNYLYYQNNIDFYPIDAIRTLEEQIQLSQEIIQKFTDYGIPAEIIAEFENLL